MHHPDREPEDGPKNRQPGSGPPGAVAERSEERRQGEPQADGRDPRCPLHADRKDRAGFRPAHIPPPPSAAKSEGNRPESLTPLPSTIDPGERATPFPVRRGNRGRPYTGG